MKTERAIELLNRISDSQFDGEHGDERREALSMAVRALEQNLVKESGDLVQDLVKDCISRQQAIDALHMHLMYRMGTDSNKKRLDDWINGLPSAQETHDKRTETHECDLINRQQAIDAVVSAMIDGADAELVEGVMELLPSAQPRKKGKWIPVDSFSAFGGDEAMWMAHGNPVAFYYCSECKEQAYAGEDGESLLTDFCPSCGADMKTGGGNE